MTVNASPALTDSSSLRRYSLGIVESAIFSFPEPDFWDTIGSYTLVRL